MATKTLNTVVALTAAFILSIVSSASADLVVQDFEGSFEDEGLNTPVPFADDQLIGSGGAYNDDLPAIGFGAPLNPDLQAANGPISATPEVFTTNGGTPLNGGGSRSATFTVDWRAWNNTEINNPGGDPGDDAPAQFFAGTLVKNQRALTNLSGNTGWTIELGYTGETTDTKLQAIISDREYSYGLATPLDLESDASGEVLFFSLNENDYIITDRPEGADPVNDRSFSDVLSNVTAFGIALLRPNTRNDDQFVGGTPIATVTLDNITIIPEPASMVLLGAGCMLLVGSRKLRRA